MNPRETHKALLLEIERQRIAERDLKRECVELLTPILAPHGFQARIVLYPAHLPRDEE